MGEFGEVSSVVSTQVRQWKETDTGRLIDVTAPDNVLVAGRMANGAVVSAYIGAVPFAGSGYRMEIYGEDGTLVVTGHNTPQFGYLRVQGAHGGNTMADLEVPSRYVTVDPEAAKKEAFNVGQLYTRFAESIRGTPTECPDFDTAVGMHRVIDQFRAASDTGRRIEVS